MDRITETFNQFADGGKTSGAEGQNVQSESSGGGGGGGFLSGLGNKINAAAGGGRDSEKNEDFLDKGKKIYKRNAEVDDSNGCRRRLCAGTRVWTRGSGQ